MSSKSLIADYLNLEDLFWQDFDSSDEECGMYDSKLVDNAENRSTAKTFCEQMNKDPFIHAELKPVIENGKILIKFKRVKNDRINTNSFEEWLRDNDSI